MKKNILSFALFIFTIVLLGTADVLLVSSSKSTKNEESQAAQTVQNDKDPTSLDQPQQQEVYKKTVDSKKDSNMQNQQGTDPTSQKTNETKKGKSAQAKLKENGATQQKNPSKSKNPGIKIGLLADQTRGTKELGKTMLNVSTKLFDEYNRRTKDPARKILYTTANDEYSPARTRSIIKTFFSNLDTDIILNIMGGENFVKCKKFVEEGKIGAFFPIPGLSTGCPPDLRNCIVFRPPYDKESYELIKFTIKETGVQQPDEIAFFYQNDAFGKACILGAERALKEAKIDPNLVKKVSYQRNNLDISEARKDLKGSYTVLGIFATPAPAVELLSKSRHIAKKRLCSMSILGSDTIRDYIKPLGMKIIFSSVVPDPETSSLPIAKQYREFAEKFNLTRGTFALETFINTSLLIDLIEKTQGEVTKETLLNTLEKEYTDGDFGGFKLKLTGNTRNLSHTVWIANEKGEWSKVQLNHGQQTSEYTEEKTEENAPSVEE